MQNHISFNDFCNHRISVEKATSVYSNTVNFTNKTYTVLGIEPDKDKLLIIYNKVLEKFNTFLGLNFSNGFTKLYNDIYVLKCITCDECLPLTITINLGEL